MVISNPETVPTTPSTGGNNGANSFSHPSGIPQDQIDNIMSGIANTGDVKMNNHRKKLRQRFDIIKKLGQGTYGKVQLGINKETGQEVAIKTIKKCKIEAEADLVRIRREVQIMSSVQHPNIIHIYEVFENREKMVLVMEFAAGGELYDYLSERKVLSEEEARRIFRQVATAVYYCHKHKICHRDLKLENILLDQDGNAKIADFGLSNVFDDQRLLATFCGSPLYASPEIVEGTPYQGPEVDCWSLGVLLYTLVYGSMPFDGSNFKRLVKQISQGDYYEPKKPSRASSLIRNMLTVCPRKRATIEQICSHWWVNEHDNMSCLDLAEDLANQTPVRLDVLLSLTPTAITADQLVVTSTNDGEEVANGNERMLRSHSVGSIRDIPANTEAERKILDMVAAGGEAALMPSPTRTISPVQSPIQAKRKLQPTVSTENAVGTTPKKKEMSVNNMSFTITDTKAPLKENVLMEMEDDAVGQDPKSATSVAIAQKQQNKSSQIFSQKDMELVGDLCEQLIHDDNDKTQSEINVTQAPPQRHVTAGTLDSVKELPEEKNATKVIKKFVNKHKTADLVNALNQVKPSSINEQRYVRSNSNVQPAPTFIRKCSLQDDASVKKFNTDRRKSRILETAEKFQLMNADIDESVENKKKIIPSVSVGIFKKEFENKTLMTNAAENPTPGLGQVTTTAMPDTEAIPSPSVLSGSTNVATTDASTIAFEASNTKHSDSSMTLDEARRSMKNSIALLRQAQSESSKEVDQMCAETKNIEISEPNPNTAEIDRERKLKSARAIIGNAIQPVIRRSSGICKGDRGVGFDQIRVANGNFIGGVSCSGNNSQLPFVPIISASAAPTAKAPPVLLTPSSHLALAAAKKTIQDRLFAGSVPQQQPYSNREIEKQYMQQQQQHQQQHHWHSQPSPLSSLDCHQTHSSNSTISYPNMITMKTTFNNEIPFKINQQQHNSKSKHLSYVVQDPPIVYCNMLQTPLLSTTNNSTNMLNAAKYVTNVNFNNSRTFYFVQDSSLPAAMWLKSKSGVETNLPGTVKTSTASITLKSATLPRRKPTAKTEIQLAIKPRIIDQPAMRFTTEMQHPIPDLRSGIAHDGGISSSSNKTVLNSRASSLEPKEHIIPIQRPPQNAYTRTSSVATTRSGSLSRQSTIDSESDTTTATNISQSTITNSSQPIKKSPREFIIPIAVEGGGYITPREGSIEPSESNQTTASSRSTFSRLRPTRGIGSLLVDADKEEGSPFQKIRATSIARAGDDDDSHFTLHRLRSSRPVKKISQDSQSSGEEDDDDGFEILTAENLFSTLLQRVRALTNRLNVKDDFPNSSRLLSNMRQTRSPFWNHQSPFGSRLNSSVTGVGGNAGSSGLGAGWSRSVTRNLDNDMESIFSRTGATLPRDNKKSFKWMPTATATIRRATASKAENILDDRESDTFTVQTASTIPAVDGSLPDQPLDLADLDLSRLRLSKQDLETLSSITPVLPKCFQEQLFAKLPPTQARKLSRTLSMQNKQAMPSAKVYKSDQIVGRNCKYYAEHELKKDQSVHEFTEEQPLKGEESPTIATNTAYRKSLNRLSATATGLKLPSKTYNNNVFQDDCSKTNDQCSNLITKTSKPSNEDTISQQKRCSDAMGRPPSGFLSSPSVEGNSFLRRRSMQRQISRILRPDFFDKPLQSTVKLLEETPNKREKNMRDNETQGALREIRGKSCDLLKASIENDNVVRRKNSLPIEVASVVGANFVSSPPRNKSTDTYVKYEDRHSSPHDSYKNNRRSQSRPCESEIELDKHELADKILEELQLLSAVRTQNENLMSVRRKSYIEIQTPMSNKKISATRKIKKINSKEMSMGPSTDIDNNKTEPLRMVKKVTTIANDNKLKLEKSLNLMPELVDNNVQHSLKETKVTCQKSYPIEPILLRNSAKPDKLNDFEQTQLTGKAIPNDISQVNAEMASVPRESRLIRPKSYPASKLNPSKEVKKVIQSSKASPNRISESTSISGSTSFQFTPDENSQSTILSENANTEPNALLPDKRPKITTKSTTKSKLVSLTSLTASTTMTSANNSNESSPANSIQCKEKSLEKKPNKGLLYAIGQKFEKLRDTALNKDKKLLFSGTPSIANTTKNPSSEKFAFEDSKSNTLTKKKKIIISDKSMETIPQITKELNPQFQKKTSIKVDKPPHKDFITHSFGDMTSPECYIKRAVSEDNLPSTLNKYTVNKVLGLFKRSDKNCNRERRVRSSRSTSNIERQMPECTSPIYENTISIENSKKKLKIVNEKIECPTSSTSYEKVKNQGRDEHQIKMCNELNTTHHIQQNKKDNRKCLRLDLEKWEHNENKNVCKLESSCSGFCKSRYDKTKSSSSAIIYNKGVYSNLPPYKCGEKCISNNSTNQQSVDNITNNNTTITSNSFSTYPSQTSGNEINRNNLLAPSFENDVNYSSDSHSCQDDCNSMSTFISPTDEPELYFDNWSICSEDNYMLHKTPSPTVSRLSHASHLSSSTRHSESSDPNESVSDRIRRRSFYSRFNEKKPKRTSSIVGPTAVRDYYREQHRTVKSGSSSSKNNSVEKRDNSPDITQQFFRPLKLSPVSTDIRPPVYRSMLDYPSSVSKPRKSFHDICTSPSFLTKRYGSTTLDKDYISEVNIAHESNSPIVRPTRAYSSTYNPTRRSSYNLTATLPKSVVTSSNNSSGNGHIDGFATIGRRIVRPYDQRTLSLLEPSTRSGNNSYPRRDARIPLRDYTSNIARSNSRYRTSLSTSSPTNI